ncbi:MAG: type VII secretion-associated serine protease mycosin, partial [Actinomycetota bacterium]|nr:type VII secretion-associated serine protease mycosin [Actinomycetota bacterium]
MSGRRLAAAAMAGLFALGIPVIPASAAHAFPAPAFPASAVPAFLAEPSPLQGDSVRADEWHLGTLNISEAWTYSSGAGVTVAVI